jgi:hypothetical protein
MQRNMWRALLLAMTVLLVGAVPALAQTDDEGLFLSSETGSVLVGLQNDVNLAAGDEANAIIVVDGSATIEGATKAVVGIDSDIVVTGPGASAEGIFTIGGTLTIDAGASVEDVAYVETDISGITTGSVSGEIRDIQTDLVGVLAYLAAALVILAFFIWIGAALALLFSALLIVAFGTTQLRRAAFNIGNDVLKTLVVGLIMLIVPWLVIGLLAITVVGLPLALVFATLWAFVAFLGYITVGLWIGERILSRSRTASRPYGAAFLGVLILMLLSWIPLVSALAVWFGVGAVTLAGWRVLRGGGAPPVPPGYGQSYGQPAQMPPPAYAPPPYAPPPPPPPQGQWPPQGGPPTSWPQG